MFVGHACLAFAIAAFGAHRLGWSRATALRVAVLAGLFATLPDVDVVYGLAGLVAPSPGAGPIPVESFWDAGNRVHRGVTHALPVAAVTTVAVSLAARSESHLRAVGGGLLLALIPVVTLLSGLLAGAVTVVFVLGAVALVVAAHRRDVSPRVLGGAALVGLVTHPFGDLLTGEPPALLYPFDLTLVAERVVLSADPTLHLLGAFGIELATVWLALAAYFRISGERPHAHVDRRAVLGVAYAGAALALPAPTLEVSYHFVFSVLAVGVVGVSPPTFERFRSWRAAVTALSAISLAAVAYAMVYLFVG
ncbi:metal-dependent hydrolase [Halosimplex aquaticum]|uniref:Metal-dependent hydrolase n=1 Tax=Halosimplex aquaticum TaxID=3026162 RepID=A0ABD5Y5T4_9EURY|nr:metal-dependent hydrolase [Halosimplex aquaticum]